MGVNKQAKWVLIDNYDSFTYNLVQRLGELGVEGVEVIRNDAIALPELMAMSPDALIISPGPKGPRDAGISMAAVKAWMGRVPVLGVCLGHQVIVEVLGGAVVRAVRVMHGRTSEVHHDGRGLYEGVPNPFVANRYHSLLADPERLPDELEVTAWTSHGEIMGVRHVRWPLYGVQYHPESILTPEGVRVLGRFVALVEGRQGD